MTRNGVGRSTTRTAGAVVAVTGLLLVLVTALFRWPGAPTVVGLVLGVVLLGIGALWAYTKMAPKTLAAVTAAAGMVLVVAPPVLFYRQGEGLVGAYLSQIAAGLVTAAVGVWAGKRLGARRVDQV